MASASRPNVLLICWDTVRADHLTPYGYQRNPTTPFLNELAAEALVFEAASSTAGWTKPSVPSILTGTFPSEHGVYEGSARMRAGAATDVLPGRAETMAERFKVAGYETAAFIRNAQLRKGNGFEQGFDVYEDEAGDARSIRWHALDWLNERPGSDPFFLYLHYLDAHWPYPVPDEYAARFTPLEGTAEFRSDGFKAIRDAIHDGQRVFGDGEHQRLIDLYDGALRYLDDQLKRLLEDLDQRGLRENTIVCIVSDHGEEFGEHGRIGHGHGLWENLLHVPWILAGPGVPAMRVAEPVSLVDVLPTILGAAGLDESTLVSGVDRLSTPHLASAVFAEHKAPDRYLSSVRVGDQKAVRNAVPAAVHLTRRAPIRVGERWEAKLAEGGTVLVATELEPSDADDQDDPLEWKGPVTEVAPGHFALGPVEVRYGDSVRWQRGEGSPDEELREGRRVKVRGHLEEGVLTAERIKVYAEDDVSVLEVRGIVESLTDRGDQCEIVLGGFLVLVDEATSVEADGSSRLSRDAVAAFLGGETTDWTQSWSTFDLRADPSEKGGRAGASELASVLIEWGRVHTSRGVFSEADHRVLDDETLRQLEAIGYAD